MKLTPHHKKLATLAGKWSGPSKTWLDPDPSVPPDVGAMTATATLVVEGQFLRIDYKSKVMGKPHQGSILWGFDPSANKPVASWIDSFHSGATIMDCRGDREPKDGALSVLGHYGDGQGGLWGWRTELKATPKKLTIRAFNIHPGEAEQPATEWVLTRT